MGLMGTATFSQIPNGYYEGTSNLKKAELKTKLSEIITNGHRDRGYRALWKAYRTTDIDWYYENDGTILDIYSENPSGKDPYNYTVGTSQCGNYTKEGDCYNREHIIPQSFFYKASPMVSDIHFIRATDGKVNAIRSNYPFGNVGNVSNLSRNGSKLGLSASEGFSGVVFEPIDEFKGDVARMIFYFVTRYEKQIPSFKSGNMFNGTTYPSIEPWELDVLLKWNAQDPVSQTEIDRNNASYEFQGNRNPYIDVPEFVQLVWGNGNSEIPEPKTYCGTENFENMGTSSSSYATYTWVSDNITWRATDSQTAQKINGAALTLRNGSLTGSGFKNGMRSLTITTQLKFSGKAGYLTLYVNDKNMGKIPYSKDVKTTTIDNINAEGDVVIAIRNNSATNRVAIDDLQWSCQNKLATKENDDRPNGIKVHPNPVRNNEIRLYGIKGLQNVKILDLNGRILQKFKKVSNHQIIKLVKLPKGTYLLSVGSFSTKILIH